MQLLELQTKLVETRSHKTKADEAMPKAKAGAEGALKASELLDALAAGISHPSLLSQLPFFTLCTATAVPGTV